MRRDTTAAAATDDVEMDTIASRRPKRKAAEAASTELNESGKKSRSTSGASTRTTATQASSASSARRAPSKPRQRAPTAESEEDEGEDEEEEKEEDESEGESAARRPTSKQRKPAVRASTNQRATKNTTRQDASSDKEQDDEFTSSSEESANEDEADGDFGRAGKKGRRSATGTAKKGTAAAGSKPAKKAKGTRKNAAPPAAASRAQPSGKPRGRPAGGGAGRQGSGAKVMARNKEDLPIKDDNVLFNAVKDPDAALDTTAEDWVATYHDAPATALSQLVTFLLRSAACNSDVDEDEVADIDKVVTKVEDLQDAAKKESMPSYPIVTKASEFKRFRQSLSELLGHLLASAHESEALFDETFLDTLKTWVIAMSSSSLRAFRHTATLFALFLISSLNDVLVQLRNTQAAAVRQRDAERKKGRSDKARLREMEKKVQEQKDFEAIVKSHKEDVFSSVFVHRYRDADLTIRCDCVSELGLWMKKHPDQYMSGTYFTYLGWVLSDAEAPVRLAAIQAMSGLYSKGSIPAPLRHFTDRFKGRLMDMAVGETDVGVRCATFSVLAAIDRHVSTEGEDDDILDDSQRDILGVQLFDVEVKVRKACAPFVSTILEGLVEAGMASLREDQDESEGVDAEERQEKLDSEEAKLRFKSLGALLVNYGKVLDEHLSTANENWSGMSEDDAVNQVVLSGDNARQGRIGLAIKSLWEVNDGIHDVRPLVEILNLDHSYDEDAEAGDSAGADPLPPAPAHIKLTTQEEMVLIEVLVTLLRKIRENSDANTEQGEEHLTEMTRVIIEALPRLFAKYKTDATRITEVLLVPQIIKLDEYLELSGMAAFGALWDDISDQFVRHVEPALLENAMNSMHSLNAAKGFGETNTAKLSGLQEQLLSSLRGAAQDLDVEQDALTERQVHAFSGCMLRLRVLASAFDNVLVMESDDGGKLSTGWELALALASRGRVGTDRAGESGMVQDALSTLCWYLVWKAHQLRAAVVSGNMQQSALEAYIEKRQVVIGLMSELVGAPPSAGIAVDVQRVAFEQLVRLHILFVPRNPTASEDEDIAAKAQLAATMELVCSSDLQKRCTKFVENEIWRFGFSLGQEIQAHETKHTEKDDQATNGAGDDSSMRDINSSDVEDDEAPRKKSGSDPQSKKKSGGNLPPFQPSRALLKRELEFGSVIAALVSGLRLGVFDVKHAGMLLKHHGRLGAVFDSCLKILVDVLREAALKFGFANDVCTMALRALEESFDFYLADGKKGTDANFLALSRAVSSMLVLRGPHLTILRAVSSSALIQLHVDGIKYAVQKAKEGADEDIEITTKRAPGFFRGLLYMMASMQARDALKIKTEMDKAIREADVDTAFKVWDPQRTYEKRLVGIIAKKEEAKTAGSGKAPASARRAGAVEGDEDVPPSSEAGLDGAPNGDHDADANGDEDEDMEEAEASQAVKASRPRPRPAGRAAKLSAGDADLEDEDGAGLGPGPGSSPSNRRAASAFGSGAGPLSILADEDAQDGSRNGGESDEDGDGSSAETHSTVSLGQAPGRKRVMGL
ncbi:unnamed protein product [Tilletia laevis]|uniref:SCD domain-containing protein n=2 Tax=Tilletia TaxID=13289 RepID=A0A8X7MQU9_9BASI|nr:hypothetical protein CF328_g4553 [Tilletia controversa]KAE8199582.1 hypothetical protein CF335_g4137 [Tilletia laevis]CAD6887518.1 unnamed protein product [Tilletia caries]KAE8245957.1 hypothetical protein A4X06_0g5293 [Tilletia controversa]CAD6900298.1 unnamed protein product [Tilletia caries]